MPQPQASQPVERRVIIRQAGDDEASRRKAAYQRDLLQQIEDRKRREKEEKERKKQEDLLELQRIERDIEKERQMHEAEKQPKGRIGFDTPSQPQADGGVLVPKPRTRQVPAPNLNSEKNIYQGSPADVGLQAGPVALNTNVSKQYLMQHKQVHDQEPPEAKTSEIPLMEVLSQVTDLEPPPQVPVVRVEPGVSKQYLQSQRNNGPKPLTVSTVRREVQGELNRQLADLKQADGALYQKIDRKFEQGFGEIRNDLLRVNQELMDNLERIKRETKEALLSKETALKELESLKKDMNKPKMQYEFQKPFGGVVKDEIDDLIKKYSSKPELSEYNEFRSPDLNDMDAPREIYKPKNYDNKFNPSVAKVERPPIPEFKSRRESKQPTKQPNRFQSQPMKPHVARQDQTNTQMYGSINLDVNSSH